MNFAVDEVLNSPNRKKRPALIGGIDVGLHTSIALLDLSGDIACLDTLVSAKNSQILEHMLDFGKIGVISTDRAKAPSQAKKIASSISAKLLLPSKNMTKKKKRLLIKDFLGEEEENIRMNSHEKAALASAIFAYKKFRPNFKKLKDKMEKKNGNKAGRFEKERKELFLKMARDIPRRK